MCNYKENKSFRLLNLYETLNKGDVVEKKILAQKYCVSEKTIQRDIEDLRIYLADNCSTDINTEIIYEKENNCYKLVRLQREWLTNKEILTISKVILESRAFNIKELETLLDKLIMQVTPNHRKHIKDLIQKEKFSYIPPIHNKPVFDIIWDLSDFILKNQIISYTYQRQDLTLREVLVKPVALMFSEFYFYLVAYKIDKECDFPINYRIDRISDLKSTGEHFQIPYKDKFDDGEFRKRVQFMYSGKLKKIKFVFSGPSIEAILDRIPTAKIIDSIDGVYTLEAESFGDGTEMWLKTQGENIKFITKEYQDYEE